MLLLDTASGVLNADEHASGTVEGRDLERRVRGSEHGVLRIQHQVKDDLLQFALVAVDARKMGVKVRLHANLRCLELVLEQCNCVAKKIVQIHAGELRPAG